MDYYKIGQRIRSFRKAVGFSQEELASRVDISVTHMSHIETGNTKLSLPVLVLIAESLEVGTDEILFGKEKTTKSDGIEEIMVLLEECNIAQLSAIKDIVKASKNAIIKYL